MCLMYENIDMTLFMKENKILFQCLRLTSLDWDYYLLFFKKARIYNTMYLEPM